MTAAQIRQAVVGHALWGVSHSAQIQYAEVRPIPIDIPVRHLPFTTDCSGFTTMIAKWAGAPDPNHLGYNGSGNTTTMLGHLPHIPFNQTVPGDLVIFVGGKLEHVVVLTQGGREHTDPLVVSHGGEGEPAKYTLSKETSFHSGQRIEYLRLISDIPKVLPVEPGGWNEKHLSHIWHEVHADPQAPAAVKAEVAKWKTYFFELELWATAHELNPHHAHELHFASQDLEVI
jgi:hypothetical protein